MPQLRSSSAPAATAARRSGFTLLEVLMFVGIFALIVVAFMSVFVTVSQITLRQTSASEVSAQSQFLLQIIQTYVGRSSVIELTKDTSTSTLRLRTASSTDDPTIIALQGTTVTLQQAGGATSSLTSDKVNVTNLTFVKNENPGGHDSVSVSFTMEYNTSNIRQKFVEAFSTSVARVSAASFDSNVVPSSNNLYALGAASGDWKSINNTIFFSGQNVGIGPSSFSPAARLHVQGGDVYIDSNTSGLILKAPNGTSCYRLTVTNAGSVTTTSVSC